MTKEELIKILEEYEVFVDDDYGGSYQNIIAYTKDKKISNAFTSLGALKIINTFEKMQKEKKELIDYLKKEQDRLARECSPIYEDGLGKTRLVNEDIYDEVLKQNQKYKEVIDSAKALVNNVYNSLENADKPIKFYEELLDILKEVE